MPTLTYQYDDFEGGYHRTGVPIRKEYIQATMSGRIIAHDYIEHPRGFPTGTLEDEIAAFGVIIVTRFKAGMIQGFTSPEELLAMELREMLSHYREGVDPTHQLKRRNKYWKSNEPFLEDIAELVTSNSVLCNRLIAWFQSGITKFRQRFKSDCHGLSLFQDIEEKVDNLIQFDQPLSFKLVVYDSEVRIPEQHIIY